jgi:collagenase-like PrtC family protease
MIYEKYLPMGINNFKIEGRTANLFSLIETYCYFMIKPEYVGEARLLLLRNLQQAKIVMVNKPRPGVWP